MTWTFTSLSLLLFSLWSNWQQYNRLSWHTQIKRRTLERDYSHHVLHVITEQVIEMLPSSCVVKSFCQKGFQDKRKETWWNEDTPIIRESCAHSSVTGEVTLRTTENVRHMRLSLSSQMHIHMTRKKQFHQTWKTSPCLLFGDVSIQSLFR